MTGGPPEPPGPGAPSTRVLERGRSKAFRPLPPEARTAAIARGLAAYASGRFYLAHEELEPAWMGTDDVAERALLSGLIKLAAGAVHAARGNPAGVRTNLTGARERLAVAAPAAPGIRVDLAALLAQVDAALETPLAPEPAHGATITPSHDVAGPLPSKRRSPLALPQIVIPWHATESA